MSHPTYPERSSEQLASDQQRLRNQLGKLRRPLDQDRGYHQELLHRIRSRREDGGSASIDYTRTGNTLHVLRPGEILVDAADAAHAARALREWVDRRNSREQERHPDTFVAWPHFSQSSVVELEERVVRFRNDGLDADAAEEGAGVLRAQAIDATAHYVVPLGYVVKAQRSFEPTTLSRAFPGPTALPAGAVPVAIVDTGISERQRSDDWLTSIERRAGNGTTPSNIDPLYVPEGELRHTDAAPDGTPYLDYAAGHGEFVAGVLQQVAPDADIRMYRAVSSDGVGDEVTIGDAILQAAQEGAKVINLSLGTQTVDDAAPVGLRAALEILAERYPHVLVIASAGNYGSSRPTWPAAFRSVVAVAALTSDMARAPWSCYGPWVDCAAVGEGIVSTFVPGKELPEVDPEGPDRFIGEDAWALGSGTSFAAPQIAGRVVLAMTRDPQLTPRQALQKVLSQRTGARRMPRVGFAVRVLDGTPEAPDETHG